MRAQPPAEHARPPAPSQFAGRPAHPGPAHSGPAHPGPAPRPSLATRARPVPAALAARREAAPGPAARFAGTGRPGLPHPGLPARPRPLAAAARFARLDPRQDPRLGGRTPLHTAGLDRGLALAAARPPRSFLYANPHRDLGSERSQAAREASTFHTTDVRGFNAAELHVWRAGAWRNEWHYGRRGWWWEVDGGWYPYGYPVWPYPVVVADPVVYEVPVVDGPDLSVQEGVAPPPQEDQAAPPPASLDTTPADPAAPPNEAPPTPAAGDAALATPPPATADLDIPPLPPVPVGWFRCDAPSGYFPSVADCSASWTLVENAPLPGEQ